MGTIEKRKQPPGSSQFKNNDMRGNRSQNGIPRKLALSAAVASTLLAGYSGRSARAGSCYPSVGPGNYLCSRPANAATDLTQTLAGTPLTVTTVSGFGIDTRTSGGNALSLTSTGGLIFTDNFNATITGYYDGINALNQVGGALSVTTTGEVTGTYGLGINARNGSFSTPAGTDLTISAAAVTGGSDGIIAYNYGSGAVSVTSTGPVTGDRSGIIAGNNGTGALSVTATGPVTVTNPGGAIKGRGLSAIDARNSGTDLTIVATTVTGATSGIIASNYGSGALSVTATGPVTATGSGRKIVGPLSLSGIGARNSGTDLTIVAAAVTGGSDGIIAYNYGSGAVSVTSTGPVTGDRSGIIASNYGTGGLTVSAASVTGGRSGIIAGNYGSGAVSVTTTGPVTGTYGNGIYGYNSAAGTGLTISAASVTGYEDGIRARNDGSGALSVSATGPVTGGTGHGIRTVTGAGRSTTITLHAGADVSATSGTAISNDAGDSNTTVNTGATVTGAISLGDGSDDLTFDGGNFANVTTFDGGDDTSSADGFIDTLTFRNAAGAISGGSVVNWENVILGIAANIAVNGILTTEQVTVNTGATLGGGGTINGDVNVSGGKVAPGTSAGTLVINGDLIIDTGVLSLEQGDLLDVSGLVQIGADVQVDLFFASFAAPIIDFADFFVGSLPSFLPGFGGDNFALFTTDVAAVGEDFEVLFDGQSAVVTAQPNAAVPEPTSLALFGAGLLGLLGLRRVRRRRPRLAG